METAMNTRYRMIASSRPTVEYRFWLQAQRLIALLGLLLLSPLGLILYVLVKLDSRGPFLYRQSRPGLYGKQFQVFKVRSMTQGADKDKSLGLGVTMSNPKITRVGRVIRDLKIDELPQLWNVVRGEMALVGPRPIAPELHSLLCEKVPGFAVRGNALPGLTNLGQVSLWDNADALAVVKDWSRRFEAEAHYVQNRTVAYDVLILVMTGLFLLRKVARRAGRFFKAWQGYAMTDPAGKVSRKKTVLAGLGVMSLVLMLLGCTDYKAHGLEEVDRDRGETARRLIGGSSPETQPSGITVTPVEAATLPVGAPPKDYLIGPNDVLKINIFGEPTMSELVVKVDGSGNVQMPIVESVKAQGKTVAEMAKSLKDGYASFFKNPWITVSVVECRSQAVYLLGQFNSPGVIYLDRPLNLAQALAMGKGMNPTADLRSARVLRDGKTVAVDIYRLLELGDVSQNIWVHPEDTIYVPDNNNQQVMVLGQVNQPGPVKLSANGKLSVLEAIGMARGFKYAGAKLSHVQIIRSLSATRGELIRVDVSSAIRGDKLAFALMPGDIVFVPQNELEDWNDILRGIQPTLDAVSGTLTPFVQVKYLTQASR
jgi:polysaccharide biosynthesis/export protein